MLCCRLEANTTIFFIDCPPSLGIITTNALCVADTLLVPIQCEYYALEGLSQLMNTVRRVKRQYNEQLDLEGVLLTMYDGRLNLTQQVVEEVKNIFRKKYLEQSYRVLFAFPRRLVLVCQYNIMIKVQKVQKAYNELAEEMIRGNK